MRKEVKYIIWGLIAVIVLFNSVYIQALDEKLAQEKDVEFDAGLFVEGIWENELLKTYESAADLESLIERLNQNPEETFDQESHSLGIGNIAYFKVQAEGIVLQKDENHVIVRIGEKLIEIETEFIFGNAVRDASGLIQLEDYDKTSDFNSISEAINAKIRTELIPPFVAKIEEGNTLRFQGAVELNKAQLNLNKIEVIPVYLKILP